MDYRFGQLVCEIDTMSQKVTLDDGSMLGYDELVIATGSAPFVPPIPGNDLAGCFVYRTIDDLERIKGWATTAGRTTGLVIGGGLLGLEAANALRSLGLDVHVVEMAPYPMPQQLGEGGGRMLGRWVDSLGVRLHCGVAPDRFVDDGSGSVAGLQMSDGTAYPSDIVVFSAGVRPRDEVARRSGIDVGERGGIVVDDTLQTSADHVWAIGEVALHGGRVYGLVAPGYEMAAALAERLSDDGGAPEYRGSDLSTKLKLLGVDVASFGQSNAVGDAHRRDRLQRPGQQDLPPAGPRRRHRSAARWRLRGRHVRLRAADRHHAGPRHPARRPARLRAAVIGATARSG